MISAEEAKRLTDKNKSSIEIQNKVNLILEKISDKIEETACHGENTYTIKYFDEIYKLMHPDSEGTASYNGMTIREKVEKELENAGYTLSNISFSLYVTLLKIEW